MSSRRILFHSLAFAAAVLAASSVLAQQQRPNMNNPALRPQKVKHVGSFVTAGQDRFQMATGGNQPIVVVIGPNTEVSVTGKAEQDYLKAGVTVEFVAEVDKTRTVKDKVGQLLVISPTTDKPLGLLPPDAATPARKPGKEGDPPAKAAGPDPGIGGDAPPKRRPHGNAGGDQQGGDVFDSKPSKPNKTTHKAPQFPGMFTVRGTIKGCKNGLLTISAGRSASVKATLADDVAIDVDLSDFRVAQADDKVTVEGMTNQANAGMVLAESVTIELVKPLSGAKKHATRTAKTPASSTSKPKKSADDDLLSH